MTEAGPDPTPSAEGAELQAFVSWMQQVKPLWTFVFLAVSVVLAVAAGGRLDTYQMYRMGALWRPSVEAGEWWRLATCTVLHFGWLHLLFNAYSLYSVGTLLERILGRAPFLFVLVASGLGGSLLSLWGQRDTLSAGLSGALFGLAASAMVLTFTRRLPLPPAVQRALVSGLTPAIVYNLAYGFIQSGIDNYANIGGMLTGAGVTWLLYPRRRDSLQRAPLHPLFWLVPLAYASALAVGVSNYVRYPLPDGKPLQTYRIGSLSVQFGRQFSKHRAEGVLRVYRVPGLNLAFGIRSKQLWPSLETFLAQAQKEMPLAREQVLGGHRCLVYRTTQAQQPVIGCYVLDVGGDILEIGLAGSLVDGKRELELLNRIVSTVQGPPSKWGR